MALYGIIMHWEKYTDVHGEYYPEQDFFFLSPDAEAYLEVRQFPRDEWEEAEFQLRDYMDNGRPCGDGRVMKPMRFVRRYFAQQEQAPGRRITFDGRLHPAVTSKAEADTGGLPEGTPYAGLGTEKAQTEA